MHAPRSLVVTFWALVAVNFAVAFVSYWQFEAWPVGGLAWLVAALRVVVWSAGCLLFILMPCWAVAWLVTLYERAVQSGR